MSDEPTEKSAETEQQQPAATESGAAETTAEAPAATEAPAAEATESGDQPEATA